MVIAASGGGKHIIYTPFPRDRSFENMQATKITKALCRRHTGRAIPRAETFGDLQSRQTTKFSVKAVSHATISDTQSWYKIWHLNVFKHIRCEWKSDRQRKGDHGSSWSREKSIKELDFGKACKELSWIICSLHLIVQRQLAILKEQYEELEKVLRPCCYNQDSMKSGWLFYGMLLLSSKRPRPLVAGKTHHWRRFGEPFKGRIVSFGAMAESHLISILDQSRLSKLGKFLTGNISWVCVDRGANLERRHSDPGHWGTGENGRFRYPCSEAQCERKDNAETRREFHNPPLRDKRHCWKSGTQNQRRNFWDEWRTWRKG